LPRLGFAQAAQALGSVATMGEPSGARG